MSNAYVLYNTIIDKHRLEDYNTKKERAMELRELRYFSAVARRQNITKAAELFLKNLQKTLKS